MAPSRDQEDLDALTPSMDSVSTGGAGAEDPSRAGASPEEEELEPAFDDLSQLEGQVELGQERYDELGVVDSDFARELMGTQVEEGTAAAEPAPHAFVDEALAEAEDDGVPPPPEVEKPASAPSADVEPFASAPSADVEAFASDPSEEAFASAPSGAPVPSAPSGEDDGPRPVGEDLVWEELVSGTATARPDPDLFASTVARFMGSPVLERDGLANDLRSAAAALREADALEPLADAVERLALESGDPPDEACLAVARWLVTPGVGSILASRLGAAREEGRRAQLLLLGQRIGQEMAVAVAEALSDTSERFARRAYLDAMVAMGADGARVIERMVEDPRWFVVRNALAILGEVGGEQAVELLTGALAHEDPRVRREAILALAKIGGEDASMLVYGMLGDADADVRLAAAMAAGALKVERALKPLLEILASESDDNVVVGTLQALGQLADPGAVNSIEKKAVGGFFSKPKSGVRIAAYRALHHIGTPHAMQVLRDAEDDKDAEVRGAVRQLLG